MKISEQRYSSVAIILHWVMAVAFLLMLTSGLTMKYITLPQALKFNMFQWHKSLGIIVLMAFFIRIGWRLFHKPPALPVTMPGIEVLLAKAGHWALYAFMLAVPVTGWLLVSSSVYGLPTVVFGWFIWPHVPGVAGNELVQEIAGNAHWILAWAFGFAILGHILAVVKHYVFEKDNLLTRMWWTKGQK